jgi:NAD(P)-dependent dehydrogenase (short-subunit alcohol dehydrogenase family)
MTNVVIGAGSGMGAAIAHKLAPRGRLLVADYNQASVEKLAAEIGGDVRAFGCDIADQKQIDAIMSEVGELDALIVTAGLSGTQAPGRRILDVNLAGHARVLRAAEPLLRPGAVGITVASQSGYMVPDAPALFAVLDDPLAPDFLDKLAQVFDVDNSALAYQASKRGAHRLAQRLALPWGRRGARILSVSPGINDTPMNRSDEAAHPIMAEIIKASPLGRRGTPAEIANVVAFLTSSEASLMTGGDVLVDGGMNTVLPRNAWQGELRTSPA